MNTAPVTGVENARLIEALSLAGNSIWVPVAEYKPNSTAVLEELDKYTLTPKRKISVADHLGCVAVTDDALIAGNWGSRQLYVLRRP